MRLYECLIELGVGGMVNKTLIAAKSPSDLKRRYDYFFRNILTAEDVTENYFKEGDVERLKESLQICEWNEGEIKILTALLDEHMKGLKKFEKDRVRKVIKKGDNHE